MANRFLDWLKQADADLRHAIHALDCGDYELNLIECAKLLDKHYILTRYPNGFDSGAPTDFYTKTEGNAAINCANEIIEYCRNKINKT